VKICWSVLEAGVEHADDRHKNGLTVHFCEALDFWYSFFRQDIHGFLAAWLEHGSYWRSNVCILITFGSIRRN
jgi:hypothetical protein